MMRMRTVVLAIAFVALGAAFAVLGWNNRPTDWPDASELRRHRDRGISWLLANRAGIAREGNPMLWWMMQEIHRLTDNPDVGAMVSAYRAGLPPGDPWEVVFDPNRTLASPPALLGHLPDYNRFILFGASCSASLGATAEVQSFRNPARCPVFPGPGYLSDNACVTHHAAGVLFLLARPCFPEAETRAMADALADRIRVQLWFDFRVVDTYIQRVWILEALGRRDLIRAAWVRQALSSQRPDGGWADAMEILPWVGGSQLAFRGRGVGVVHVRSNFHTSVQGVLLAALLERPPRREGSP